MAEQVTIQITENKTINVSDVLGNLKISTAAPTTQGLYMLSDIGTYTNLGGLVAEAGKVNYAYFDGSAWSLIAVDMPNDAVDNLTSTSATNPLSANMGRVLDEKKADKTVATTSANGLMSGADKSQLNSLQQGGVNDKSIIKEKLSDSLIAYIEASGGGTIINNADDEDLTQSGSVLKLADRNYSVANFSGKGHKILRKNLSSGINLLTQSMISADNTIYEIRYDFDLGGSTINIPENSILNFVGGKFINGTINGTRNKVKGEYKLFCNLTGTFEFENGLNFDNFINDNDCTDAMDRVIEYINQIPANVYELNSPNSFKINFNEKEYNISNSYVIRKPIKMVGVYGGAPLGFNNGTVINDTRISNIENYLFDFDGSYSIDNPNSNTRGLYISGITFNGSPNIAADNTLPTMNTNRALRFKRGGWEASVKDVAVIGFGGTGITFDFWFDSHFTNVSIIHCGWKYINGAQEYSIVFENNSNAITFNKLHIENTLFPIHIKDNASRQLQFIGCKYEAPMVDVLKNLDSPSALIENAVIKYAGNYENMFNSCSFILLAHDNLYDFYSQEQRFLTSSSSSKSNLDFISCEFIAKGTDNNEGFNFGILDVQNVIRFNNCNFKDLYRNKGMIISSAEVFFNGCYFNIYNNETSTNPWNNSPIEVQKGNFINCGLRYSSFPFINYSYKSIISVIYANNPVIISNCYYASQDNELGMFFSSNQESSNVLNLTWKPRFSSQMIDLSTINVSGKSGIKSKTSNSVIFSWAALNSEKIFVFGNTVDFYIECADLPYLKEVEIINNSDYNLIIDEVGKIPPKRSAKIIKIGDYSQVTMKLIEQVVFSGTINTLNPSIYNGNKYVDTDGVEANTQRSGTFATKPTVLNNKIYIGFKYFATDKQTPEGATNGIIIYHKGDDIWVDSLGRVIV